MQQRQQLEQQPNQQLKKQLKPRCSASSAAIDHIYNMEQHLPVLLLGIALVLTLVIYDQATRRIPTRTLPLPWKPGLQSVHKHPRPPSRYGADIIFVHGLGSNPVTTWRTRRHSPPADTATSTTELSEDGDGFVEWVSEFLLSDIAPPGSAGDIRLYYYNYDSYWKKEAVHTRIDSLGKSLFEAVRYLIRRPDGREQSRDLIFVAHSFGGLVVKQALVEAYNTDVAKHTRGILFLGTPHQGSRMSLWGKLAAQVLLPVGSHPAIMAEIELNSQRLHDLHSDFFKKIPDRVTIINYYEQRPTLVFRLWLLRRTQFIVDEQSASYAGGQNVQKLPLPVDHSGLNKFGSRNAPGYEDIWRPLAEMIRTISKPAGRYMIPITRVETYTPRPELSQELEEKLRICRPQDADLPDRVPHAVTIVGLGGAGKTQLALNYALTNRDRYDPILWIDATDNEAVLSSFIKCAIELELIDPKADSNRNRGPSSIDGPSSLNEAEIYTVLRWLGQRGEGDDEWLLIVDNADGQLSGLKKVIPTEGKRGSIIITSRDRESKTLASGGCEVVRVNEMSNYEAHMVILRHCKEHKQPQPQAVLDHCDTLVQKLGHLPLALDLAGAYIASMDGDLEEALGQYIKLLEKRQVELLGEEGNVRLDPGEKTVWTVWETTLDKIEKERPHSYPRALLKFLAQLRATVIDDRIIRLAAFGVSRVPDHIRAIVPPELMTTCFEIDDQGKWDSFNYHKSCELLVRYSLLQQSDSRSGDTSPGMIEGIRPRVPGRGVTMHKLVQWRAALHQPQPGWKNQLIPCIFAEAFSRRFDEDELPSNYFLPYLPSIDVLLDASMNSGVENQSEMDSLRLHIHKMIARHDDEYVLWLVFRITPFLEDGTIKDLREFLSSSVFRVEQSLYIWSRRISRHSV